MTERLTIRKLLEAGAHFGHYARYWNPKMAPYIYCTRDKVHIIDLDQTLLRYQEALNFISALVSRRGKILFVGTKVQVRSLVRQEAERCGMPYVDYRWLGGMLTNYKTVRQSLKKLQELEEVRDGELFKQMTKKESLSLLREINRLEKSLGGIRNMAGVPDALFVLDVGYENIAVSEARKLKVPVIGVVDTNHSPDGIDYVIPGNDDSMRAVALYLQGVADAILDAKALLPAEVESVEGEKKKKLIPTGKKRVFKRDSDKREKNSEGMEVVKVEKTEVLDQVEEEFLEAEKIEAAVVKSKRLAKEIDVPEKVIKVAKEEHLEEAKVKAKKKLSLSKEKTKIISTK